MNTEFPTLYSVGLLLFIIIILAPTFYSTWKYLKTYSYLKKNGTLLEGEMVFRIMINPASGNRIPVMRYEYNGQRFRERIVFSYLSVSPRQIGKKYMLLVDRDNPKLCILNSKKEVLTVIFLQILIFAAAIAVFIYCHLY